jgi:pyridoxal phosphate enzyme (YggS family)
MARKIKERILAACARVKRDPAEITLVAVTKGRSIEEIGGVIAAGVSEIGENRVQEAIEKYNVLTGKPANRQTGELIKWHMVGHLQTNKVKEAVAIFDLIHSVDSLKLAAEINRQAEKINKIQDILVEVKTSPEAAKFGVPPGEAIELVRDLAQFKNIALKGLMTIAPMAADPEEARPYFRLLKELRDNINELMTNDQRLTTVSMGMSDDFEVAIEEGATMVRIGRALFGA